MVLLGMMFFSLMGFALSVLANKKINAKKAEIERKKKIEIEKITRYARYDVELTESLYADHFEEGEGGAGV